MAWGSCGWREGERGPEGAAKLGPLLPLQPWPCEDGAHRLPAAGGACGGDGVLRRGGVPRDTVARRLSDAPPAAAWSALEQRRHRSAGARSGRLFRCVYVCLQRSKAQQTQTRRVTSTQGRPLQGAAVGPSTRSGPTSGGVACRAGSWAVTLGCSGTPSSHLGPACVVSGCDSRGAGGDEGVKGMAQTTLVARTSAGPCE